MIISGSMDKDAAAFKHNSPRAAERTDLPPYLSAFIAFSTRPLYRYALLASVNGRLPVWHSPHLWAGPGESRKGAPHSPHTGAATRCSEKAFKQQGHRASSAMASSHRGHTGGKSMFTTVFSIGEPRRVFSVELLLHDRPGEIQARRVSFYAPLSYGLIRDSGAAAGHI